MPQIAPFDGRAGTSRDGSPVDREQVRSLKIFLGRCRRRGFAYGDGQWGKPLKVID